MGARGEQVVFHADWFHGAQFAGIYVAEAEGFYQQADIELEWRDFVFGQRPIEEMNATPAVCAIGAIEGYIFVQRRAAGHDVRAVAAMFQESPAGYISLASAGIRAVEDFAGRRIGVHTFADPLFRWFLQRGKIAETDVDMRFTGDDVAQLTRGELDAMQGYATEEYLRLRTAAAGAPTRFLSFAELGFSSYSEILYVTAAQAETHPATIRRFVEVTRRGWSHAFKHPDETAALVARRAGTEADIAHIRVSLDALRPYVMPDAQAPLAPMTEAKWMAIQRACREMGLVSEIEPADRFLWSSAP